MADVTLPSAPLEEPAFLVIREGTQLRPSIRIIGRVNGQPVNVPTTDRQKALAAFDRLLDSFLSSLKGAKAEDSQPVSTVISDTEKLDVLLAVAEQSARDIADVKTVLVTYQEPAANEPTDIWEAAFGLAEELEGLDRSLGPFDPVMFAQYCVFGRSVINGAKLYPDQRRVDLARALATGGGFSDSYELLYADLVSKWQVDRDVAIAALLTGLVDPYDTSFNARLERDVAALAGTIKPETLSTGEVIPRFVRLDMEGLYRRLLPSGSGGQAGQGGEG